MEANAEKLIDALDKAEEDLGYSYRICVFALDLVNMFQMDISVAELNNWVVGQAEKDSKGILFSRAEMFN